MLKKTVNEIFLENNIKNTSQRRSVFNVLSNSSSPMTAENIYSQIVNKIKISLSSVYRILDVFFTKGLIEKVFLSDQNSALYEISTLDHSHFLRCTSCKCKTKIPECPISEYEKEIQDKTSFHITNHKLEFYGRCSGCQNK